MKKSIDERVKEIMLLKDDVGEFSLDLYYDDGRQNTTPYVAKIHNLDGNRMFHARAADFQTALDQIDNFLFDYIRTIRMNELRRNNGT